MHELSNSCKATHCEFDAKILHKPLLHPRAGPVAMVFFKIKKEVWYLFKVGCSLNSLT